MRPADIVAICAALKALGVKSFTTDGTGFGVSWVAPASPEDAPADAVGFTVTQDTDEEDDGGPE